MVKLKVQPKGVVGDGSAKIEPDYFPLFVWAKANGISRSNIYRRMEAGELRVVHIGHRLYVTREQAADFKRTLLKKERVRAA